jgi:hypothetical protein
MPTRDFFFVFGFITLHKVSIQSDFSCCVISMQLLPRWILAQRHVDILFRL